MAKIKHLEAVCPKADCKAKAFVQVVVVDDPATQKEIDKRANKKLNDALVKAHKVGDHD